MVQFPPPVSAVKLPQVPVSEVPLALERLKRALPAPGRGKKVAQVQVKVVPLASLVQSSRPGVPCSLKLHAIWLPRSAQVMDPRELWKLPFNDPLVWLDAGGG